MYYKLLFFCLIFSSSTFAQITNTQFDLLRQELLSHINNLRTSRNLSTLVSDPILQRTAKYHSDYLASVQQLSHEQKENKFKTPRKRVLAFGGEKFSQIGENVLSSAPINFPLNNEKIANLAEQMFLSWKKSKGHYENMIYPDYDQTGLDFSLDKTSNILYATNVLAKKEVFATQAQDDFEIKSGKTDCTTTFFRGYENLLANMGNSIQIVGDEIKFYYHNRIYFDKILSHPEDGIAVDLVVRDQFDCGTENQLNSSSIYDGTLLKPSYRNTLLENNEARSNYRIITTIGNVPDNLVGREISPSLILLKNGRKCRYLIPANVPHSSYELRDIEPRLINPEGVQFKREGIIASETLNYDFKKNISSAITYPSINPESSNIHSIQIKSFSSVEGDSILNARLHNQRAKTIQEHLGKRLNLTKVPIEIEAKENWEKMDFQLKYFFADHLLMLSKDSLKSLIAAGNEELAWDSLLFVQRKSTATIHYLGRLAEDASKIELASLNLRIAVANRDFDLANKAMYEIYHELNDDFNEVIFEEAVFEAIKRYPELLENATAILSKLYYSNEDQVINFLNYWNIFDGEISKNAEYNLLHLYTLLNHNLLQIWDLPAKRLSNVIHPKRITYLLLNEQSEELLLNVHLSFVKYYGQINDGANISRSFDFIVSYFQSRALDAKDEIDLVLFFNNWSRYDLTNQFLLPKFRHNELNEDAIFILLKTLYFYEQAEHKNTFESINESAIKLNSSRWCSWIDQEFQSLRSASIKQLYCENCTK